MFLSFGRCQNYSWPIDFGFQFNATESFLSDQQEIPNITEITSPFFFSFVSAEDKMKRTPEAFRRRLAEQISKTANGRRESLWGMGEVYEYNPWVDANNRIIQYQTNSPYKCSHKQAEENAYLDADQIKCSKIDDPQLAYSDHHQIYTYTYDKPSTLNLRMKQADLLECKINFFEKRNKLLDDKYITGLGGIQWIDLSEDIASDIDKCKQQLSTMDDERAESDLESCKLQLTEIWGEIKKKDMYSGGDTTQEYIYDKTEINGCEDEKKLLEWKLYYFAELDIFKSSVPNKCVQHFKWNARGDWQDVYYIREDNTFMRYYMFAYNLLFDSI